MNEKQKNKLLKDSSIIITRLYQNDTVYNTILAWRVSDYEELSCNVLYFQLYESVDLKCVFRLYKDEGFLHLSLTSPNIFKDAIAEFLILDEVNSVSVIEKAEQLSDGVLVGKFSNEQFLSKDSGFLLNGVLTVAFKYVSDFYSTYNENKLEDAQVLSDFDQLCYDLKRMYLGAIYPDFKIHARDCTLKCHRYVLAGRSKYFEELLHANKKMTEHRLSDDVVPGILHETLLYIYSGELKEMDEKCMLKVYRLAVFLKVDSLCSRCLSYFKMKLNKDNYLELCELAVKCKLIDLKNMIIHAINDKYPDIGIMKVFIKLEKENDAICKQR